MKMDGFKTTVLNINSQPDGQGRGFYPHVTLVQRNSQDGNIFLNRYDCGFSNIPYIYLNKILSSGGNAS